MVPLASFETPLKSRLPKLKESKEALNPPFWVHEIQVVSEAGGWCPEWWWHTWQRRQRLKVCS
ncbi:hypothetical protein ES332_A09G119300v1 [Gossypium tomentosum]|uniref:Uncharacterized protein n=1 Tax=Gossypium tomentosum TaxID=34277 RepID=A0A5D2P1H4_GOSTO|nr:hypothetical protein ES332_A09G119300v1 [Gossypium tomentosum]